MRKSPLEETFFVSLGSILERLEINPPSCVQRRLLQITHTGTDSEFYRASHRTGVSCLSSGEVTRRNPRLCLFFVDKDLHWWLCLNMQENQSYCLKKPFPVAEIQSWTSSCFRFCCQLIDENPYSTWKSEKQKGNLISFRVWKDRNQSPSTRESFSIFWSTWFFQNPIWGQKHF